MRKMGPNNVSRVVWAISKCFLFITYYFTNYILVCKNCKVTTTPTLAPQCLNDSLNHHLGPISIILNVSYLYLCII